MLEQKTRGEDRSETGGRPPSRASTRGGQCTCRSPSRGETRLLVLVALAIGVGSGLGAYRFRWLIGFVHSLLWERGASLVPWAPPATVVIPAVGGALVGPIVYCFAREAKGHGVPEVMLAIAQEGGRIRPRVVFVKALASAICIGSGGSAGREGPIVQIGSALGSALGQALKLSPGLRRTDLAAGAAGGIAANFNAPIGGVVFSLEVLLRDFSARAFSVLVLASVTATVISRALLGNSPAFVVPPYELKSPWELLFYALLGCLAARVAKGFIWLLYRCEDLFDAWSIPEYVKPVVGGLSEGLMVSACRRFSASDTRPWRKPCKGRCPPGCWLRWSWASSWRRRSRSGPAALVACSRRPCSWGRPSAGEPGSSSDG